MFTVGKKVEVSFEGESLRDCWVPATILQNLDNNTLLVAHPEYPKPGTGDVPILNKVTVDYSHIRPSPPRLRDKKFVLLEKVDAYYDFGWWSGVITKKLDDHKKVADHRYNVFFKHTKKEREFFHSKVRPHMEWKGGKWLNASEGDVDGRTTPSLIDEQIEQTTPSIDKQSTQVNLDINGNGSPSTKNLQDEIVNDGPRTVAEKKDSEGDTASVAPKRKRGRPPKLRPLSSETSVTFDNQNGGVVLSAPSVVEGGQKKETSLTTSLVTRSLEENHGPVTEQPEIQNAAPLSKDKLPNGNSGQDLDVQPGRVTNKYSAKKGKRRTISINVESPAQDSQDASKEKINKGLEKCSATRNPESFIRKSLDAVSDDRILSRAKDAPINVHGSEGIEEQSSEVSYKDLPFVRNMSLWRTIESMPAFRKLPQKPHFRPLLEGVKESAREGLAIGTMVTFSTVVDKTCDLRVDDPRSKIEDSLETLAELETNGFDVGVIRERLTQLLSIKDKQDELAERSKGVAERKEEHSLQWKKQCDGYKTIDGHMRVVQESKKQLLLLKEKLNSELEQLRLMKETLDSELGAVEAMVEENDGHMRVLQELNQKVVLKKEKWDSEIGAMEAIAEEIGQEMRRVGEEFEVLAATPL